MGNCWWMGYWCVTCKWGRKPGLPTWYDPCLHAPSSCQSEQPSSADACCVWTLSGTQGGGEPAAEMLACTMCSKRDVCSLHAARLSCRRVARCVHAC